VGTRESPGKPGEQQRDADLDRCEQEWVVIRARVSRSRDVPTDVQPVGEASAREFGDQREEPEGKAGQEALVSTRPIHAKDGTPGDPVGKRG
jgi:hypothetical protein